MNNILYLIVSRDCISYLYWQWLKRNGPRNGGAITSDTEWNTTTICINCGGSHERAVTWRLSVVFDD